MLSDEQCVILIGMAGSGKSTVGLALAERMHWTHVDTDLLIEASYGACLQDISDALGKTVFLDTEAAVVSSLKASRAVISTGGSVIYREETMRYLQTLGPIVFLDVPLPIVLERIARNPNRGLAINPGQTIEELFSERERLYRQWGTHRIDAATDTPETLAATIMAILHNI